MCWSLAVVAAVLLGEAVVAVQEATCMRQARIFLLELLP